MTNSEFAYIKGRDFVNVFIDGDSHTIHSAHPNYEQVLDGIRENDAEKIRNNLSIKQSVENMGDGIKIHGNTLYVDGEAVHNTLADRIVEMARDGFDIEPMKRFLRNLEQNPSRTAVQELYDFLESGQMPITDDGCFLAYKKVRGDYTDIFTGKFDNSVGAKPEMPRNRVDDNRENTCSSGLHFCSLAYLPHFGAAPGNRVMIVKINPADVVSIPKDYDFTKGRACTYEVVDEHTGPQDQEWFARAVYEFEFNEEEDDVDELDVEEDHAIREIELPNTGLAWRDIDELPASGSGYIEFENEFTWDRCIELLSHAISWHRAGMHRAGRWRYLHGFDHSFGTWETNDGLMPERDQRVEVVLRNRDRMIGMPEDFLWDICGGGRPGDDYDIILWRYD